MKKSNKHRCFVIVFLSCASLLFLLSVCAVAWCVFSFTRAAQDMESVSTLHIQLFKNVAGQVEILKNETQKCWGMVALFSKPGRLKPLGTFVVTAYSSSDCTPFSGKITSTLLPVGSGVAAVDPTLIPYGTVLFVPALKRYFFAYDTGSDVRKYGRQIDLFFDKGARVFGRRFLEIWVVDFSERS